MLKDKSHIITVFSIFVIIIITFFIVQWILKPKSFNEHGFFRFDNVKEFQRQQVITQDINICRQCHNDIYQLHEKDAHYTVPCNDCHGAGNLHVAFYRKDEGSENITKEQAYLEKEYKLEGCLFCHRKLKAKPTDYPQIDQSEHYSFLHVIKPETKCIECHSPHEPVFLLTEVRQSRIHPIIYRCTECHEKTPEKSFKEVAGHPIIFECKDCHADIVEDFNKRPHHNYVDCRTCHLFHKENSTAGRIYKNGNAQFCLLCHEKKPFKDDKFPPKIEWPAHVGGAQIVEKGGAKICLDCHELKIHKMKLNVRENPHPQTWRTEHIEFARKDLKICENCHTMNQCYSCHMKHKPATHDVNWKKSHPNFAAKNKSSCEICHGKEACISCHKVDMPHPKDFVDTHKDIISQKGKQLCYKCHNEEFCKQCH